MKTANIVELLSEKVGSQRKLAEALSVTPQAVSAWKDREIPPKWVLRLEAITGVSRHKMRPDLYPPE